MGLSDSGRPKVLVLWSDNRSPNLGVRALAAGAAALADQLWDEPDVTFQDFAPNSEGFSLGKRSMIGEVYGRRISRWVNQFDVVLDTGAGDSFSDIYGLDRLVMMYVTQRACIRSGGKLVLVPQTIGPFGTRIGRALGRRTLRGASAVFARDPVSAEASAQMGARVDAVGTDMVFALPVVSAPKTRDVILNVSGLLWNSNPHVPSDRYRSDVIELVESCIKDGRGITLLPHVLDNPSEDNDMVPTRALQEVFGDRLEVALPESLVDARTIIASGRVLVGARMHACLNALSVGTPAIAWSYSRKFAPLMNDLGWTFVIDIRSGEGAAARTRELLRDEAVLSSAVVPLRATADRRIADLRESLSAVL